MQLIPFTDKWAQQYADMLKAASEQDLAMTGSEVMSVEEVISSFQDKHRWDRLMVEEGHLVGDVNLFLPTNCLPTKEEREECRKPEVNVFVSQTARKKGFARQAIKLAIEYCMQQGYEKLFAVIDDQNSASISFFTACGFRVIQRVPAFEQSVYSLDLQENKM